MCCFGLGRELFDGVVEVLGRICGEQEATFGDQRLGGLAGGGQPVEDGREVEHESQAVEEDGAADQDTAADAAADAAQDESGEPPTMPEPSNKTTP